MNYAIKEFRMIPVSDLIPHPDALAYPSDADDRASLDASIEGVGVLEPLTVIETAVEWLVIDGCGRLEEAVRAKIAELPCLVVECDSPREFAAHKNAMGRKRSTGSRVLCYLMANLDKVMEAAATVVSHDTTGKYDDLPTHLKPWTSREIAKRLAVSNKDVVAAVQLVVCQTHGVDPDNADLDEEGRGRLDAIFTGVMCARTPVRRWRAALGGKQVAPEASGRAATNFEALSSRTVVSLRNVFAHWYDINPTSRAFTLDELTSVFKDAPEEVRLRLAAAFETESAKTRKSR